MSESDLRTPDGVAREAAIRQAEAVEAVAESNERLAEAVEQQNELLADLVTTFARGGGR